MNQTQNQTCECEHVHIMTIQGQVNMCSRVGCMCINPTGTTN